MMPKTDRIAIIGLGYVGLPLAVEFAKQFAVVGFDINDTRIAELKQGKDQTLEVEPDELKAVLVASQDAKKGLFVSSNMR